MKMKSDEKEIIKQAQVRYEKWGVDAVYGYFNSLDWEHWSVCTQCDATTPSIAMQCGICGTKKERMSYNETNSK